jgi:hypothetical protein
MRRCGNCGVFLPAQARGRPRRYCSTECRWRAGERGAWPSRICVKQRCPKIVDRDGLCSAHYRDSIQSQKAWTVRDQILDWLSLDGGWLTALGMADELGRNVESIERVLRELRREGLVKSRVVELARSSDFAYDRRTEWSAA